jgi:hypothetical protein
MAKPSIPDPLNRRHLIEREMEPDKSIALADAYLEDGRILEAVIFLLKAGADDRLEALSDQAVSEGDAFLLKYIADGLQRDPGAERWHALAENAVGQGKARYAEMAKRHARSSEEE